MANGSIVDYLNQQGQDSSYNARKRLAEQYGIGGYSGTAAQNTQLLKSLQGAGAAQASPSAPQAAASQDPNARQALPYPGASGPGSSGGIAVQGQGSPGNNVTAGLNVSGSSEGSFSSGNSPYLTGYTYDSFGPSERTEDYFYRLQDLEANAPGDYKSRWQDDIDSIVDGILNRPKFETDDVFDSDLYKMYREQYINQGQRAMRDATGNMAGLTGGYGSTYAAAAGQQAYDNYLNQLGDQTLNIYDRVYNQYLQEGQEMYDQLGMLNNQDSIDYGRYRDDVNDYYRDLDYYAGRYDQSYNADFGEWQADLAAQQWAENYAYQKTQDALAQQNWQAQFEYQKQQDAQAQANWQAEFDYQKELDAYARQLQAAKGSGGGGGGGSRSRKSSGSSKRSSSTQKTSSNAGYAPVAAGVLEKKNANGWTDSQAYDYVMGLGEQGRITQGQVDDILNAAGIDEEKALDEKAAIESEMNSLRPFYNPVWDAFENNLKKNKG